MRQADVVVVGAGAAGLAAAAELRRNGIDAVLLERDAAVGGTWARRYDRLHLHTVREYSGLPGLAIPRERGRYVGRDDYAAYLRAYARHFRLHVVSGLAVEKIRIAQNTPMRWEIIGAGESWQARVVVVATGQYRLPCMPSVQGLNQYGGEFRHSVDYRNARPYAGKRVLVVGAGNSGAEIATDLAEGGASFVALSIRTPPPVVPRDPFGQPVQKTGLLLSRLPPRLADCLARLTARLVLGDLTRHGYPDAAWWPYSSRRVPVIDVGFVRALKERKLQARPALASLGVTDAVYADGSSEPFDAIIAATGFGSGLDALIEAPGVLDASAQPLAPSGEATASPGLYFIGFTHSLRGHLFEAGLASQRLATNVARYLEQSA
jgi:cation diffusion facilitator CzcD-associated flavoprotein CzcO